MRSRMSEYLQEPGRRIRSAICPSEYEKHRLAFSIAGLILGGLVLYLGYSLYPEAKRYLHIERM